MHRLRDNLLHVVPLVLATVTLMLAGCASRAPVGLETDPPDAPTPRAAQAEPERHTGQAVRWGGEILAVDNAPLVTRVELFSRPLYDDAEPMPDGGDGVRFLAEVPRFLDPAEYRRGKRMTVTGRLAGNRVRTVGEYPYPYPVVEVERHHLWPVWEPPPDPAWRYDPWWPWGPFGPYRRWPYWW